MKHNNEMPSDIRKENDEYNVGWITSEGMVGDNIVTRENLDVDESIKLDASPFMVVWLKNIDRLMSRLPIDFDHGKYTLVDVGCGSGISTIYFYKKYAFKHFIGFDFSSSLISIANKNNENIRTSYVSNKPILFEVGDAKNYRLLDEPLVLFMFNPFGWETMRIFIENNADVLRKNKSILLYANDICVNEIVKYGRVLSRDDFFNLSIVEFGR